MSTLTAPDEGGLPVLPVLPTRGRRADRAAGARSPPRRRLPEWLKRPIPEAGGMYFTRNLIGELGLETICESGRCPNRSECWTRRTATFMILGDVCTRPCGFCAVKRGQPEAVADRRARPPGRGLRPARPAARGDHLGDPRRPARRRRRALPPLHPGRPRPDRRDDRGADARLRRPGRGDRHRPLGRPRGLQPQPRDRRPPPATRPAQEPVRASA